MKKRPQAPTVRRCSNKRHKILFDNTQTAQALSFCEKTYSTGSLEFSLLLLKDIIICFIFFKLLLATVQ